MTYDYEDGKLTNHDTGEEVEMGTTPSNDTMPEWLWAQHHQRREVGA